MCCNSLSQSSPLFGYWGCFSVRCYSDTTQLPCTTAAHTCPCFTGRVPGSGSKDMWSFWVLIFTATLPSRRLSRFTSPPYNINLSPRPIWHYLLWPLPDSHLLLTPFPVPPTRSPTSPLPAPFPTACSACPGLGRSTCSSCRRACCSPSGPWHTPPVPPPPECTPSPLPSCPFPVWHLSPSVL